MGLLRGPADGQRAARRAPRARARLQGHLPALQDDARPPRRAQGRLGLPRPAGRDRRRAAARHHDQGRRSRRTGSRSSTRKCRESVFEYLEDWNALTERIGFWVDLDDAYRTLDADLRRVGLVGAEADLRTRACSTRATRSCPYCPRCGTALSSHEVALGYKDVVDPSVYVRFPVAEDGGPVQAGDELLVWTTTPWTLVSNAAVAVDPELTYVRAQDRHARRAGRARRGARRAGARRRAREVLDRFPGAALDGVRYEPPFPFIAGERVRRARPHRPARRLRHRRRRHRPRAHRDRLRRGRLPPRRAVRPERRQPGARSTAPTTSASASTPGASSRTPTPTSSRTCARAAGCCAPSDYEHAYPHCWRCGDAAALLRQAVLVHRDLDAARPPARRQRDGQLASRSTSSTGASATGSRTTSTGRCRASATGARRCRSGAARTGHVHVHRLASTSSRSCRGVRARGPAPPVRRRRRASRARSARGAMARVPEVIDVWFDSGAMPFAQWHAPFENEDALRGALPRRLHLRGARPDARLVLLAARGLDAAVRPVRRTERRLPRPDPRRARARRCRSPRATSSRPGRSSTASAPTRCAGTSSPPSSRGTATASRWRRSARACGCSCASCGTRTRFLTHSTSAAASARRRADRPRPLGALAPGRDGRGGHRAPRRLRRDRRPAARSPRSSTTSPTGTCGARAGASGRATRAAFATLRDVPRRPSPSCSRRSRRSSPTRSTTTSTARAVGAPVRLAGGRRARDARRSSAMAIARETVRARPGARAAQAKVKVRQPLREAVVVAAGRERDGDRAARRRRARRAQRQGAALRRARPTSSAPTSSSRTTARSARASARRCRRSPRRSRRSTRRTWRRRCATGGTVGVNVDGHDHELGADDLQLAHAAARGLPARARGRRTPSRSTSRSTTSCAARGSRARSSAPSRTRARPPASTVADRIALTLGGDDELLDAAREHEAVRRRRDARGRASPTTATADGEPRRSRAASCGSAWRRPSATARHRSGPGRLARAPCVRAAWLSGARSGLLRLGLRRIGHPKPKAVKACSSSTVPGAAVWASPS